MVKQDMRFDEKILKPLIGKKFVQYKCDPFIYSNSVTQICGLYIDDDVYKISNVQQVVDYYGNQDDIAIFSIERTKDEDIKSCYEGTNQIVTPINEIIESISLVNEHQMIAKGGTITYDVWLTRGVIIKTPTREISFEKSTVPFSEEIEIYKGEEALSHFEECSDFLEGWDEDIEPAVERKINKIV